MFKKLVIALIVIAVAVVAVKRTWIGSHFRLWAKQAGQRIKDAIPPEREIARLKMELEGLRGHDERIIDIVARQAVEADRLDRQVVALRADLAKREKDLRVMHQALTVKGEQVAYNGTAYDREKVEKQLRLDFSAFESDEAILKSREAHLVELRKGLTLNRQKLGEVKLQRERMATELQKLETALAEERRVQATQAPAVDDGAYRRLTAELEAVKEKVALMKARRELRARPDEGPIRAAEKARAQDERIKARLSPGTTE